MYSTDREQFDAQLSLLCQGYGFWVGDRSEAYWKGLSKMSLSSFMRCVEFAIGEDGPEKLPNTHAIWKIHHGLRAKGPDQVQAAVQAPPPEQSKWLMRVNSCFLLYLKQRRLIDGFKGDINLPLRRAKCLELVAWFEGMESERDPEATRKGMERRFAVMMAAIPDAQAA